MITETRKKTEMKKNCKATPYIPYTGYPVRKVLRLEKKNDGVKDDKSGDDDTEEVR